jgi:hypothetical protein
MCATVFEQHVLMYRGLMLVTLLMRKTYAGTAGGQELAKYWVASRTLTQCSGYIATRRRPEDTAASRVEIKQLVRQMKRRWRDFRQLQWPATWMTAQRPR